MSAPRKFRDLLFLPRKFVGTILQFPCPEIVEMIKEAGYDYIIIDNEHSYATQEQTLQMLRAAECVGIPAMLRIPHIEENIVKTALDMGFSAIRAPTVSSVEDALCLIQYAKFPPDGKRGACPFVRANRFGGMDKAAFYEKANRDLVLAVNIEGEEGVRNMEEIIRLDGIDIINVGRVDLSVALGVPGQTNHPLVEQEVRRVSALCVKYGKYSGTYIERPEQAADYRDCPGITHFLTKTPESVLIDGYRTFFQQVTEHCKPGEY